MKSVDLKLKEFLTQLGLNNEEIAVYQALLTYGSLTVLEISRKTGITRTQVYRLLDQIKNKGLAVEIIDEHKKFYKPSDPDNLEKLIKDEERKIKSLKKNYLEIEDKLLSSTGKYQPGTKILFYRGKSGIQQLVWNELRAKGEIVGYTDCSFIEIFGKDFVIEFYQEMQLRKITFRDIYSDIYLERIKNKPHLVSSHEVPGVRKLNESRYLPTNILEVNHQIDIYNDTVAYYNWFDGELFGVEIYNEKVAKMQKQIFELLWKQAIPEDQLLKH